MSENQQLEKGIKSPHDHDVLSGRGNFVNYHAGNEYFRGLVRKHKIAYIACPKPQKGKFSRIIVDEIRMREPPGRFLKQDLETKLWYDIGDKKALDKTRQALREGAPELLKDIDQDDEEDEEEFEPTSCVVNQGYNGHSGFGVGDETNFTSPLGQGGSSLPLGGVTQMQVNRVVPGMMLLPSGTAQLTSLRGSSEFPSIGSSLQAESIAHQTGQVISIFAIDQYEPTPINPNAQIKVASSEGLTMAPLRRGIQRDDSFTFEHLFTKEKVVQDKPSKKMEGSSQHLSAMSFSIGDMTDASNLSAVFEDSMRVTDPTSIHQKLDANKMLPPSNNFQETGQRKKPSAEMSVASSFGSLGLESSMMHMSFRSGLDDDKEGR